jgi:hypothetical protein
MRITPGIIATVSLILGGCAGGGSGSDPTPIVPGSPGAVELLSAAFVGTEGSSVDIILRRNGGSSGSMEVTLLSADQSALGGLDYAITSTPISFADGEVSKTIPIALSNDGLDESDETFTVQLTGGTLGAARSATVTIRDAIRAGRIELTSAVYSTGESGGSVLIGVRRIGGPDGTATTRTASSHRALAAAAATAASPHPLRSASAAPSRSASAAPGAMAAMPRPSR